MYFISIKVTPNSKSSEVILKNGQISVKVKAIPDDGKANKEVIKTFKEQLNLSVEIVKGLKQREKIIASEISQKEIEDKLAEVAKPGQTKQKRD